MDLCDNLVNVGTRRKSAGIVKMATALAMVLNRGSEVPYIWRALSLAELKDYRQAEDVIRKAMERFPSSAHLSVTMGHVLGVQGRYTEAEEWYDRTLLRGSHPEAYVGLILDTVGKGDWQRAEIILERAQVLAGDDPDTLGRLASAALLIPDRRTWALDTLERVVDQAGTSDAYVSLAIAREAEDPQRSQNYLSRARQLWTGTEAEFHEFVEHARRVLGSTTN